MRQLLPTGLLVLACLAATSPALGKRAAPPPVPQRVAQAQAVVVGKVTAIEEKTVSALPFPGAAERIDYQVAVVKIDEGLLGVQGLTHVRVGFQPQGVPGRYPPTDLVVGQEGCFFLTGHPTETFYLTTSYYGYLPRKDNPAFDRELEQARRAAKLLADPAAGLQARDAADRYLTAALLVVRYRIPPATPAPVHQEKIDALESRRILLALAEADWSKTDPVLGYQLSPQTLFAYLNPTPEDGWRAPQDPGAYADAARKWLRDNADKYRVQRYVLDKPAK
jgi:hypothetical protein